MTDSETEAQPEADAQQLPLFPFQVPQDRDFVEQYAQYRTSCPVVKVRLATGGEAYAVMRYRDARRVFSDPVFSRAAACVDPEVPVLLPGARRPEMMFNMDGPDHVRQHGLTVRTFTTAAAERFRPRIQGIADRLMDRMLEAGPPAEFISAFGNPFPNHVIFEIFGVPTQDYGLLLDWLTTMLSYNRHTPEQQEAAYQAANAYFGDLVERRRAEPGDDLISALIQRNDEEGRFTEHELVSTIWVNVSGGTTAAANILPNMLVTFAHHPEQWRLLRERPELIPSAVAEVLRYTATGNTSFERLALEDVELSGVHVPAGSVVIPLLGSANMDAEAYPQPERFDITRPLDKSMSPHLGYGHGPHRCVGSALANVEMEVALGTLIERTPHLRLAVPVGELQWERGIAMRRMLATPVTW